MSTGDAHLWLTSSTHRTSEGLVVYQYCACGRHRVMLVVAGVMRRCGSTTTT